MSDVASLQGEDLEPEIRRFVQKTSEDYRRFGGEGPLSPAQARQVAERVWYAVVKEA